MYAVHWPCTLAAQLYVTVPQLPSSQVALHVPAVGHEQVPDDSPWTVLLRSQLSFVIAAQPA